MTRYVAPVVPLKRSVRCPVCGTWFYRSGPQQKYDKPWCVKIARSIGAAKRRQEAKKHAQT